MPQLTRVPLSMQRDTLNYPQYDSATAFSTDTLLGYLADAAPTKRDVGDIVFIGGLPSVLVSAGTSYYSHQNANGVKVLSGHFIENGAVYRNGGCVLRQDTANSGWYALDDTGHEPLDVASVTTSTGDVVVNFAGEYRKIVSFIAAPDEALAKLGFACGASVDLTQARIELSAPLAFDVEFNGTTSPTVTTQSYFDVTAVANLSTGATTFTHPTLLDETTQPVVQPLGGTDLDFTPEDATARGTFFGYCTGPIVTRVRYDAAVPEWVSADDTVNLGFFFNSSNGITISYSSIASDEFIHGAQVSKYGDGSFLPYIKEQTGTLTRVKFTDYAGTIQTIAADEMDFSLNLQGRFRRRSPAGKYHIQRGVARVDADDLGAAFLDQNSANIWCSWVMKL